MRESIGKMLLAVLEDEAALEAPVVKQSLPHPCRWRGDVDGVGQHLRQPPAAARSSRVRPLDEQAEDVGVALAQLAIRREPREPPASGFA